MAGFSIDMGVPEMDALWTDLLAKQAAGNLNGGELRLLKKLQKTLPLLAANPRHPGLASHEIEPLSKRFGVKAGSPISKTARRRRVACSGCMGRESA